mmetsp:Transcript_62186/g.165129  ORF Transcript_62186/g.165129 Transcript_62186/m.165129 type:complete len:223 (-) Transcript_62186:853-1521(-)
MGKLLHFHPTGVITMPHNDRRQTCCATECRTFSSLAARTVGGWMRTKYSTAANAPHYLGQRRKSNMNPGRMHERPRSANLRKHIHLSPPPATVKLPHIGKSNSDWHLVAPRLVRTAVVAVLLLQVSQLTDGRNLYGGLQVRRRKMKFAGYHLLAGEKVVDPPLDPGHEGFLLTYNPIKQSIIQQNGASDRGETGRTLQEPQVAAECIDACHTFAVARAGLGA